MSFAELRACVLAGLPCAPIVHADQAAWADAAAAAACGDFDRAETLCRRLEHAEMDPDVAFAARITLGSVLRQTGRHAEAGVVDASALEGATADTDRADALIGLAADAVGRADAAEAAAMIERAARAAPADDRRISIRLGWVRTEHALLTLDPSAVAHARVAVHEARAYGSARHLAKSMLFLGAALDAGANPEADRWLADAERTADAIGARPIATAAHDLLRDRARLPGALA